MIAAGGSSERINHPHYLVNLLKNLASIASTQAHQDTLKNANSTSILSNAGNDIANGFTGHEQPRQPIHAATVLPAGKTFYSSLDAIVQDKHSKDLIGNDVCITCAARRASG
jgi:replicative DNA helicase